MPTSERVLFPERPPRKGGGRRAKVTTELLSEIAERCSRGVSFRGSCLLSKIPEQTVRSWLKRHPQDKDIFDTALARFVDEATKIIFAGDPAGLKRSNGLQFILERVHHEVFGRKNPIVSVTNTSNVVISGLSPELNSQFLRVREEIAALPSLDEAAIEAYMAKKSPPRLLDEPVKNEISQPVSKTTTANK